MTPIVHEVIAAPRLNSKSDLPSFDLHLVAVCHEHDLLTANSCICGFHTTVFLHMLGVSAPVALACKLLWAFPWILLSTSFESRFNIFIQAVCPLALFSLQPLLGCLQLQVLLRQILKCRHQEIV